jgi:HTH-type transcriptional regulator, competence development regulator
MFFLAMIWRTAKVFSTTCMRKTPLAKLKLYSCKKIAASQSAVKHFAKNLLAKMKQIEYYSLHTQGGGITMQRSFGNYLRDLRESRGLTLRQVEEQVRVSNAYLSQLERGDRGIPNLRILRKLAEAYGISVTELVNVAEKEASGDAVQAESPEPDVAFVSRGYEKLSKENKQHLTEFLQFLMTKEQRKSGQDHEKDL